MSAFLAAVDQAEPGPGDGFVLAIAHGGLREPERGRPVRRG
ncbi:MAG: hypothetical protein ACLP0L_17735 [Solirubrobacteraceae bacterium]